MPLRNPFKSKKYTNGEFIEMEALQRFYRQDVAEELHPYLSMSDDDDHVPRFASTVTDLERSAFQTRIGSGSLAMEAENLLVNVLQYQRGRHNRDAFRNGYLNDPRNLLCELFKDFAVKLSVMEIKKDTLDEIDSFIRFIHHITMSSVFVGGVTSEETIEAMLIGIRNTLRYQVRPTIVKQIAAACSREHLQWFIQSAKRVLSHGVQFLYFVLRDTENTPRNCTIPNLQAGKRPISRVIRTHSGRLLQALVLSAPYQQVFPVGYVAGGLDPFGQRLLESNIESFGMAGQGKVIVPLVVAQLLHQTPGYNPPQAQAQSQSQAESKGRSKSRTLSSPAQSPQGSSAKELQVRELMPHVFLGQDENSGIARPFRRKKELLEAFVKFHELLLKVASLIQLLEQAKSLAGEGGDLLVYGVARRQVTGIVVDFILLGSSLRDCMNLIEQSADGFYQHLVRENKRTHMTWKENYLQVSNVAMLLADDLDSCHDAANRVRQEATNYGMTDMRSRLQKLRGTMAAFIKDSEGFSKDLRGVLQLKGSIPDESAYLDSISRLDGIMFSYDTSDDSSLENQSDSESDNESTAVTMRLRTVEVKPGPRQGIEIRGVSPAMQTLEGCNTQVTGVGIMPEARIFMDEEEIKDVYFHEEAGTQVLTFKSPAVDTPGKRSFSVVNPDGTKDDNGQIVFYDARHQDEAPSPAPAPVTPARVERRSAGTPLSSEKPRASAPRPR